MNVRVITIALIWLTGLVPAASADAEKHGTEKHAATRLTGEIVDTGCYLGHAARGAKHVGCATKCIANGMPMGLLTNQGTLYLIVLNHENADPYNQLKEMAGKTVVVTGTVVERSGMKGVDVTGFKLAAVPAAK